MKKLLLSLVGILCSMSMWADTYEWSHDGQKQTLPVTAAKGAESASTYSGYSISYGGKTYTSCIKMESSTTLTFTTTKASTITVGVALKDGNAYDNAGKTALSLTTGSNDAVIANTGISSKTTGAKSEAGLTVTFSSVPAGTQVIKRAGSEEGVFYIKVEEEDANKVSKPTITPTWGASYGDPSTVTITCSTNGASIYYTTNGDTPTSSSTLYSASFNVNTNCTVKAIAIKDGMTNSSVASQDVTINNQRNINFDFSAVTLTQGSAIANTTSANNATYKLPSGRMYYIDGKTQTGWNDGTKDYALGAAVTIDKDYTFTPVFADNNVELGDVAATVNWTFATAQGAPSAGIEGNVGYYAAQTTVGGKKLDVVMTIDARQDAGISGSKGKWNTTSADNRAQVNKGTVFTIPAIEGMVVTITITNGTAAADMFTFADEQGIADTEAKTVTYTYNGAAATIDIIDQGKNTYPSGISVAYPVAPTGEDSDLTLSSNTANVDKDRTATVTFTSSSTGAVTANSSNTSVATVAVNGNNIEITGVAAGTATVTVAQAADTNYKAGEKTITVTVTDPYPATTIFSATATTAYDVVNGTTNGSLSGYATVNGGSMTVTNGQTSDGTKPLIKEQSSTMAFSATNGNTYFNASLDNAIEIGDVISMKIYGSKSSKGEIAGVAVKTAYEAQDPNAVLTSDGNSTWETYSYTVKDGDDIVGATALAFCRTAGTTTYFTNITISRPATVTTANINAQGYGTFSCEYNVQITGAKAYKAVINNEGDALVCTEIENGLVPAGEGVLLFKSGTTEATTATALYVDNAPAVSNNELKATTLADGSLATLESALVLSGNTFVPFNGGAFTANKAYLPYALGAKAVRIVFPQGGQTTGINTVSAQKVANAKFIENGRIVIVKDGAKYNVAGQVIK